MSKNFEPMASTFSIILSILFFNMFFSFMFKVHSYRLHEKEETTVTSIETVYGDIYDCIDVYKQPSLSHSALRDHEIMMAPNLTTFPYPSNFSNNYDPFEELWKSKEGCPDGTVPIPRTTMNGQNNSTNNISDNISHSLKWNHGKEFAGIYSKPGKRFIGTSALLNVYNPKVRADEYSSATIFLGSGDAQNLNQIEVGWIVYPKLYGDYRTRAYSRWTIDNYQKTGCYNIHCPGFIVVNKKIPLDVAFKYMSVKEGKQFHVYFYVALVKGKGWWLCIHTPWNCIGYWPISLFPNMKESATSVRFGGQVFTPFSDNVSPQMGSGVFKNGQYDKTCHMRQVMVIEDGQPITDVDNSYINGVKSRCYFSGDNSFKNERARYSFLFGGPGGIEERTCLEE